MTDETQGFHSDSMPPTGSMSGASESIGSQIGPYKLLQEIGEGGMGTVYMAQQEKPVKRRVALKIIKQGMDTKQVVARFEAERQALSMMDHTHIAKVLDVGATAQGRPFFVMELIKGLPITRYCDDKNLNIKQRLQLFVSVCNAVQHAHQRGIIHRDLKPSNILVADYDGKPVPKIIDFGLAKALHQELTDKTMFTQLGQVVGTLEYMSPEQSSMNELEVDTRTDIYSLGVLLYELLTGTVPFDKKRMRSVALDQVLKIIREEDPPKPSLRLSTVESSTEAASHRGVEAKRLGQMLRGDLDWIVMKAVEKDRSRRYETANGLAMDVQRYRDGEPVLAAPPSTVYRLRKFVRRNRAAVIAGSLVLAALVVGVLGTSIGLVRALDAGSRAQQAVEAERTATQQAKASAKQAKIEKENAKVSQLAAEYSQYVSDIQSGDIRIDQKSTRQARSILKAAPTAFRNWEWAFLANQAWRQFPSIDTASEYNASANIAASDFWSRGSGRFIQEIIPRGITGLLKGAFTRDGNSVVISLSDGRVGKFSLSDGKHISNFPTSSGNIFHVATSPDGEKLGGFVFSGGASVWKIESNKLIDSHDDDFTVSPCPLCQWSPKQNYFISAHFDRSIRLWDGTTLKPLKTMSGHKKLVTDLFIPQSEDAVWSASIDGTVRKWSLPEGQQVSLHLSPLDQELEFQAISPDGRTAVSLGQDGSSLLWEIATGKTLVALGSANSTPYFGNWRHAVAFSPDGSCVAIITDLFESTIYDVKSGKILNRIEQHGSPINSIEFSPDSRHILTLSLDGSAKVWTCISLPSNGVPMLTNAHTDIIYQMDIDPAGNTLLTGSYDSTAQIWELQTQLQATKYVQHESEIVAVDLNVDGSRAATLDANGHIHVWDVATGNKLFDIDPESKEFGTEIGGSGGLRGEVLSFPAPLSTGIFSPDGAQLVAFQKDSMKVFDARTGDIKLVLEDADKSGWPVFSYDSSLVAILELNAKQASVWDLRTGKLVSHLKGHRRALVMMAFSPIDNRIVTGAMESRAIIWDARTGELLRELDDRSGSIQACRFSSDGKFVIAGYADNSCRIWDANDGKLLSTLVGHNGRVRDIRINPDQTRFVSWALDDKAIVWDFASPVANQLLVLDGDSRLLQAHWSPDGRDIITSWSDGSVKVWSGATREDLGKLVGNSDNFESQFDDWRVKSMNHIAD